MNPDRNVHCSWTFAGELTFSTITPRILLVVPAVEIVKSFPTLKHQSYWANFHCYMPVLKSHDKGARKYNTLCEADEVPNKIPFDNAFYSTNHEMAYKRVYMNHMVS